MKNDLIHRPPEELVASILEKEQRIIEIVGRIKALTGEAGMKEKAAKPKKVQEPPADYNESAIVIYETPDGVRLDVKLERDTLWLTQKQMSDLFATERSVITKHLNNIFASGELDKESNVQKMHIAGSDGPVVGWPFETTLALSHLVFSGIMERYPGLKVVSHHLGGMIPFFWGRLLETYDP